jgi:hypothetical protein
MGYLLTHVVFLTATPMLWNVGLLVASDIALLARAVYEEQTLAKRAISNLLDASFAGESCGRVSIPLTRSSWRVSTRELRESEK